MKVVILAGGYGTRLMEETTSLPKPLVEIGGKPILWHIMKIFSHYGYNEFVICLGYKGHLIKEYFLNYQAHMSDISIDLSTKKIVSHKNYSEPWKITLIDTKEDSQTGGRLKLVEPYLDNKPFFFTYGDGVADVDISKLLEFHKKQNKLVTVTAVTPPGRYGVLELGSNLDTVEGFSEKTDTDFYINGGFFVCQPSTINYIKDEYTIWEKEPLENLAREKQLAAYRHTGFWQSMDTLRDRRILNEKWEAGAPWKVWN